MERERHTQPKTVCQFLTIQPSALVLLTKHHYIILACKSSGSGCNLSRDADVPPPEESGRKWLVSGYWHVSSSNASVVDLLSAPDKSYFPPHRERKA